MRSYEIAADEWAKFKPGDACPCCGDVLAEAPRLTDADPVRALCLGCASEGLLDLMREGVH